MEILSVIDHASTQLMYMFITYDSYCYDILLTQNTIQAAGVRTLACLSADNSE